MCHISPYCYPFRGDSTRYEVDIAEKELMYDYKSVKMRIAVWNGVRYSCKAVLYLTIPEKIGYAQLEPKFTKQGEER